MPARVPRRRRTVTCLAALAVASPLVARADPFDPARVSADAKYVVHVDVDALRPTQLWHVVDDRLAGNEQFGAKIGQMEMASGMRFPQDVHDVTIYGREPGDAAAVFVLHAKMDRAKFTAALGTLPSFASDAFGKYDLLSWTDDDGKTLTAAFHDDSTVLIAQSAELVKTALDVMDGKADHAAADSALAAGAARPAAGAPPTLVYVAAIDPGSLARPGDPPNPVVQQVDSGFATVTERPTSTTRPADAPADGTAGAVAAVHVSLKAKSPDAAQQLQNAAAGIKAMVGLAALGKGGADPRLALAAAALRTMTLTQTGPTVEADVSMNLDRLAKGVDQVAAQAKAKADAAGDK